MLKYYGPMLALVLGLAGVGVRSLPVPTTPAQPVSHHHHHHPTTPAPSRRHATTHLSSLEAIWEESGQVYEDGLSDHTPEVHLSKPVSPDSKPVPSDSKPVPSDSEPVPRHPRPDLLHSTPANAFPTNPHDSKTPHATTPDGTLVTTTLRRRRRNLYDNSDHPREKRRSRGGAKGVGTRRIIIVKGRRNSKNPYGRRRNSGGQNNRGGRAEHRGSFEPPGPGEVVYTNHSPKTVTHAYAKASGVAHVSKIVG